MRVDSTALALLVAGIPAAVAAGTFLAAEVIRARSSRDARIAQAVGELAAALERVGVVETYPLFVRWYQYGATYVRPTAAAALLVSVVRRRDREVALWLLSRTEVFAVGAREARVVESAALSALLRLWAVDPRGTRRRAAEELAGRRRAEDQAGVTP